MRLAERPNVLLGLLLGATAATTAAVAGGLAVLTVCHTDGVSARVAAALTACVVFFHRFPSVPVGALALAALTLTSLGSLAVAIGRAIRQQLLLRRLPLIEPSSRGSAWQRIAGGIPVAVLPTPRPSAFCFGLLRPRIVISDGLLSRLDPDALQAALWHEIEHARRREPLRSMIAALAARTFFWIPVLRDLLDRYRLSRELTADRLALAKTSQGALAAALYQVAEVESVPGAAALADLAAARVERLLDPEAALPPLFCRRRLVTTAVTVATLLLLLASPASVDVGVLETAHAAMTSATHALLGAVGGG